MVMARAALAPAVSPKRPGSASGFLVKPCIMAPATASAAPTKIAATSLGKRISRSIKIVLFFSVDVSASQTSLMDVSAAPTTIAMINMAIKARIPAISIKIKGMERGFSFFISLTSSLS